MLYLKDRKCRLMFVLKKLGRMKIQICNGHLTNFMTLFKKDFLNVTGAGTLSFFRVVTIILLLIPLIAHFIMNKSFFKTKEVFFVCTISCHPGIFSFYMFEG